MRHRRLHGTREPARPARRAARASSTGATTRPGSPWSPRTATCSSRSAPARWPTCADALGGRRRARASAWATPAGPRTAGPSDLNAHPHSDCSGRDHRRPQRHRRELPRAARRAGQARGTRFESETDTRGRGPPRGGRLPGRPRRCACAPPCGTPEGAYALVVMHRDEPDRLVGARLNAPLIVGVGEGESFLASDVAAIAGLHQAGHLPRGRRRRGSAARHGAHHRPRRVAP